MVSEGFLWHQKDTNGIQSVAMIFVNRRAAQVGKAKTFQPAVCALHKAVRL